MVSPRDDGSLSEMIKASQLLSGEIVLKSLLEKMMPLVMEPAGAERGFLLLPKERQWFIEAEGVGRQKASIVLQSLPFEDNRLVSAGIVSLVARSRHPVLLENALVEGPFTKDDHIVQNQVQSVFCAPLIHQEQLMGILYLENNSTVGAFTPDRLQVLKILFAQAAISLKNARLCARLSEKVHERTAELTKVKEQLLSLMARTSSRP